MDLLFKRYANPFIFLDKWISSRRFCEFINRFIREINKEKEEKVNWEYFLNKVYDLSYIEFKESLKVNKENQQMSNNNIETTLKKSKKILNNFTPKD